MENMNSTRDYIRNLLDTIRYDFGDLMVANIFWALLILPIITIPAAFAGLNYSINQLVSNEPASRKVFFEGVKKYFRAAYLWFIFNVVIVALLLFNIDLGIRNSQLLWLQILSGICWVLLAVWLLLQIYTIPLLIRQEEPKLLLALRNSALLWFKHTAFSIFLSVVMILLIVVSLYLYPLWFVITGSLIAYLANLGVVYLLSKE